VPRKYYLIANIELSKLAESLFEEGKEDEACELEMQIARLRSVARHGNTTVSV
jgi:hypothetical protein